ncbi:glycosyltransferase [Bacteroides xylanisolvens]|uniref:glycosyltransferase n=1 Tax=Bacteroides xylanisolvens TaxID=371601 RepID=UPI003515A26F
MINIVISATNLVEGGPLSILDDLLSSLNDYIGKNPTYKVIAIVHDKKICFYPNIQYIEIKWAKSNWLFRLYSEYVYLYKLSKSLNAHLWLSLHDTSPNVKADIRAVYCHNPTPFYKPAIRDLKFNYKEYLFSLFYKYLYRINIHKNDFVIVQQSWIRDEFCKMFHLNSDKVIVAYPKSEALQNNYVHKQDSIDSTCVFFYPAYPRTFKNIEVICEACKSLNEQGYQNYKVILTVDGTENAYAKYIYKKYNNITEIDFHGIVSHQEVFKLYASTNCLLFPSKLETWGLPISEFSSYNKPMLVADLPYAHETASGASCVSFFSINDSVLLSERMKEVIAHSYSNFGRVPDCHVKKPYTNSWIELVNQLLGVSN